MEHSAKERVLFIVGIGVSLALCGYYSYLARHILLDDALIYYRYIANALQGNGLVYNVGERFNALTSPLYTYISLLFAFLFNDVEGSQIVLGALFLFLTSVTVMMIFSMRGLTVYGVVAAMLLVTTRYYYYTLGLETTLFLFLISMAVCLYLAEREFLLGIVSGLLVLARGEGIFLILTLILFYYLRKRKLPPARSLLAFVAVLLPHYLFNLLYYGQLFPHTLTAKISQGQSGLWGEGFVFLKISYMYEWFFDNRIALVALPLVLAAVSFPLWLKERYAAILLLFVVCYSAFYIFLNLPNYHWYYAVYYYSITVLAAYGLKVIHGALSTVSIGRLQARWLGAGLVMALGAWLLIAQIDNARHLRRAGPTLEYKAIGIWLDQHTPPDSKVASVEIGHIGWFSKRYIVDILGLVSFYNAELLGKREYGGWLRYYRPDYILVHDPLWGHELSVKPLIESRAYVPVLDFPFKGYLLLTRSG